MHVEGDNGRREAGSTVLWVQVERVKGLRRRNLATRTLFLNRSASDGGRGAE